MEAFDLFILGQPCLDINVDYTGETVRIVGGAVAHAGHSAASTGVKVAVLPKCNLSEVDVNAMFTGRDNITVFPVNSEHCTSIQNVYHTADREKRTCTAISRISPYQISEIPDVEASVYHIAGLMEGDFSEEIIAYAASKAKVAVDVQCLLRYETEGAMLFHDWKRKLEMLPLIDFLKTDAAEAEVLTGMSDRVAAAKQLHQWGAKEIMITHNTEALVYDGEQIHTCPLKPRNLSGRTGRGDTIFAAYLCERLHKPIPQALLYASALVSLKMETSGPFRGGREDVEKYIAAFYR